MLLIWLHYADIAMLYVQPNFPLQYQQAKCDQLNIYCNDDTHQSHYRDSINQKLSFADPPNLKKIYWCNKIVLLTNLIRPFAANNRSNIVKNNAFFHQMMHITAVLTKSRQILFYGKTEFQCQMS